MSTNGDEQAQEIMQIPIPDSRTESVYQGIRWEVFRVPGGGLDKGQPVDQVVLRFSTMDMSVAHVFPLDQETATNIAKELMPPSKLQAAPANALEELKGRMPPPGKNRPRR